MSWTSQSKDRSIGPDHRKSTQIIYFSVISELWCLIDFVSWWQRVVDCVSYNFSLNALMIIVTLEIRVTVTQASGILWLRCNSSPSKQLLIGANWTQYKSISRKSVVVRSKFPIRSNLADPITWGDVSCCRSTEENDFTIQFQGGAWKDKQKCINYREDVNFYGKRASVYFCVKWNTNANSLWPITRFLARYFLFTTIVVGSPNEQDQWFCRFRQLRLGKSRHAINLDHTFEVQTKNRSCF